MAKGNSVLLLVPALLVSVLFTAQPAFAAGKVLLKCRISGGGYVSVHATDSKKKVDLVMDSDAANELDGVKEASGLDATFESADSGSTAGPIEIMEVGKGYYGDAGDCGFGLEFNTNSQRLGRNRDIPLKPSFSYNKVECKKKREEIESCSLGEDLHGVSNLKDYVVIEVAD
jgi:hypothetical protein